MPALLCLVGPRAADARPPAIRLDRVDAGRCASDGLVTALFAELTLEGALLEHPAAEYRLVVDDRLLAAAPVEAHAFAETPLPLGIAVVLQVNLAFAAETPQIVAQLQSFLRDLPPRTAVSVITYGATVEVLSSQAAPAAAATTLDGVRASRRAASPALEAMRAGLELLGTSTAGRRLLVPISDGLDDVPDRDAYRALGNLARARGVEIDPIAHSPTDERGPLLNLGEIARRSTGTFRWAEAGGDLGRMLASLGADIAREHVSTFEVPDRCAAAHRVQIARDELRSNVRPTQAQPRAGGLGFLAAGVLLALGVGLALARLRRRRR